MRIAVTRPEDDQEPLLAGLTSQGHEAIAAALMHIEFLPPPVIPARNWQALAVTSANSLKALASHPQLAVLRDVLCCCVGPASAKAAQLLGFEKVRSANGGLKELAALMGAELDPNCGPILYLSGETISGDLQSEGLEIERLTLYRAKPVESLPGLVVDALKQGTLNGVVLYSPRTARIWLELLQRHGLSSQAIHVLHYCLSANVACVLPSGVRVRVAAMANDSGILELTAADRKGPA
jgi:uroporphyrinogen-III synthase